MLLNKFERMSLSSTPVEEPCSGMGKDPRAEQQECATYRRQLERMFPIPDALQGDVSFVIINNPYDGGGYKEAGVKFNVECPEAVEFAYNVEENMPMKWDERAKQELAWYARRNDWLDKLEKGQASDADVPDHYRTPVPPALLEAA